jgi:hypothetical protein
MLRLVIAACALVIVACGDDDGGSSQSPPAAELTVVVRPQGADGPPRERRIECEQVGTRADPAVCRHLSAERLAPVPDKTACITIYGGPAVARVTGTLRREAVDARFDLTNGCEIARWKRNRELLGAVP